MSEMREYSGTWRVAMTGEARQRTLVLAQSVGLSVELGEQWVEFEYNGRDSNRFVVTFLLGLAAILRDAQGEVECVTSGDGDPKYEFFTVVDGTLVRQVGRIVRGPAEQVDADPHARNERGR
jgi:hypothetical protein